ncbi:MAG: NAD(P)/FAD-dependent oxidoreductase [Asgard group archaeon]|nr:NAD(P)/FAD-dependent oxidoreductase [Asgard group archaeon]
MESEILVVGGGPIGSLAAEKAAKENCQVMIFDQRLNIGVPEHCAGLLSLKGLKQIGLSKLPADVIQNSKIKGAIFHSPSGLEFKVFKKHPQAVVVNRSLFDQHLSQKAEDNGALIFKGRKVSKVFFDREKKLTRINYVEKSKNQTIESFITIIAEGRKAKLTKESGFKTLSKKYCLSAKQVLAKNVKNINEEFVEIFVSNKIAPGFFAWIIPVSDSSAKIGMASQGGQVSLKLETFLRKFEPTKKRLKDIEIIEKYSGQVLVGGPIKKFTNNGIMIAGDASGQTKATTGGGVITGGLAGIIAGKIAAEGVKKRKNSRSFLRKYDQEWNKRLEGQLVSMKYFRRLANRLSDKSLDNTFKTIIDNNLDKLISAKGDIDSQFDVIISLLRNPEVIKLGLKTIPDLLTKS